MEGFDLTKFQEDGEDKEKIRSIMGKFCPDEMIMRRLLRNGKMFGDVWSVIGLLKVGKNFVQNVVKNVRIFS